MRLTQESSYTHARGRQREPTQRTREAGYIMSAIIQSLRPTGQTESQAETRGQQQGRFARGRVPSRGSHRLARLCWSRCTLFSHVWAVGDGCERASRSSCRRHNSAASSFAALIVCVMDEHVFHAAVLLAAVPAPARPVGTCPSFLPACQSPSLRPTSQHRITYSPQTQSLPPPLTSALLVCSGSSLAGQSSSPPCAFDVAASLHASEASRLHVQHPLVYGRR